VPVHHRHQEEEKRAYTDQSGKVWGENWHVFIERSDFDAAWGSVPRPGSVVTEREIREDPVLRPMSDELALG
jgi:hypothetical protein